ncbi:MAG TPA: hypothetical protein VF094_08855 [Gaiellaceae bacterium]
MSAAVELVAGVGVGLDSRESARLAELEHVVEQGLQTFVEVGLALAEIRDGRLYRATHSTFAEYCDQPERRTGMLLKRRSAE